MKTNVWIALMAIVALTVGFMLQRHDTVGQPVAAVAGLNFSFPDVDGRMQAVSQWRGKILVINFWATWCPPCVKEMPAFVQWQREFQAGGVQFVGISLDDQKSVADYLQRTPVNYPILVAGDEGSTLAQQLGNVINAVPFTIIVDSQGQIIHRQPGELSREQFLEAVQPLLAAKRQMNGK